MGDRLNTHVDPPPTTERYIDLIMTRIPKCEKHPQSATTGGCHVIITDIPGALFYAVCNWRARQAGFVGEPSTRPAPKPFTNERTAAPGRPRHNHTYREATK